MVSELDQQPQIEDIVDDAEIIPVDEDVVTEPVDEEPDPVAALRDEIGTIKQAMSRFDGFDPSVVKSDLGRVRALQSKIDQLTANDPLLEVDPRISANESLLLSIADALINSDFTDDQNKANLRSALTGITESKTQRERKAMKQELLSEIQSAATPTNVEPTADPQTEAATARIIGYAEAKGIDPKTIPAEAWNLRANETLTDAVTRVRGVVDALATQTAAAGRTAERRQAAGNGSPVRSGANNIAADRERLMDGGLALTETAKRKAIADALGIALEA